jgi:serine/threonine protein phosphatase 1
MRLYAIGDVHGCLDRLSRLQGEIEADLAARPVADWRIIHLGDYVDRGPDSHGVIEFLLGLSAAEPRIVFLRGNHDAMFEGSIAGDRRLAEIWLNNGGVETLESYGLNLIDFIEALREERPMRENIPRAHRDFLEGLAQNVRLGDYYFVHAGIEPDRPLEEQDAEPQLWIRGRFLSSEAQFEAVVVHGHTPVPRVEVRPNRIGIDTGAVFGGTLSCLVLEGAEKGLLVGSCLEQLPAQAAETDSGGRGLLGRVLRLGRR